MPGLSPGQAFAHCAVQIEASLDGYRRKMPAWYRATIGRLARALVFVRGDFSGDPLAPNAEPVDTVVGMKRLYEAIGRFKAHRGMMAEHWRFGRLTKDQYAALHTMVLSHYFDRMKRRAPD